MIPTCQVYVEIVASFWWLRVQLAFFCVLPKGGTGLQHSRPYQSFSFLIEPQRLPCWLWVDMMTTLSPKKLPDFLIATINKFLLFPEGKEGGFQADLLNGTHLSEQLSILWSHMEWELPAFGLLEWTTWNLSLWTDHPWQGIGTWFDCYLPGN